MEVAALVAELSTGVPSSARLAAHRPANRTSSTRPLALVAELAAVTIQVAAAVVADLVVPEHAPLDLDVLAALVAIARRR